MALTSADVNNQSFSIDRKGYNVDEVDVFLERVAAELDELNAQVEQLTEELQAARRDQRQASKAIEPAPAAGGISRSELDARDARIAELEAQIADHKAEDNAIAQALIVAQRSADEILANANGAAETTRQDAQVEAQRILDKANAEKQRVLDQIKKLEDDREAARDRFSDMLNDFVSSSQDMLSDLAAGKGRGRGSHTLPARAASGNASAASSEPAATVSTATYTTPTVTPVVATPATPKASTVEKDFSGFGDTDDGFEFDDVD